MAKTRTAIPRKRARPRTLGLGAKVAAALGRPTSAAPQTVKPHRYSKRWESRPAVVRYGDGREVCNPVTDAGRAELKRRTLQMLERQGGWCCFRDYDFCPGRLHESDASFEHEHKRTAGKHDSRIVDRNGKPINGAAHIICNSIAGSRRLPIWHGESRA